MDIDGAVHRCLPAGQAPAQVPGEFHPQELFDNQLPVQRLHRVVRRTAAHSARNRPQIGKTISDLSINWIGID